MSYRYSIIVPHYDGSIKDETFERGIKCLLDQTQQNFEVLLYHDGPTSRPIPEVYKQFGDRCRLEITQRRENDWGHSNRDRGIRLASGEYILHFNPDNILYHNSLEEISKVIDDDKYPQGVLKSSKKIIATNNIVIFPIYMINYIRFGFSNFYGNRIKFKDPNKVIKTIFTGDPCVYSNIDCFQLVMKKTLWLGYGGWYDKRSFGDGVMYQRFVEEHGARYCSEILGEHH